MTEKELKEEYEIYKGNTPHASSFETFRSDMICSCPLSAIRGKAWGENILVDTMGNLSDSKFVVVLRSEWEEACKILNAMQDEAGTPLKLVWKDNVMTIETQKTEFQKFERIELKPLE